jgi:polyisoprenoid-binding protein YceI
MTDPAGTNDPAAITGTWAIDPTHTTIGFSIRHAMIAKVRGRFTEFDGTFVIDSENVGGSTASLTIQAASFTTENADRDAHVKSADFLDVENFPTLTFTSTSAVQQGSIFTVTGDLTIHGVTQSVPVEFDLTGTSTDPWGGNRIGFEGTADISRSLFGLTWNTALETGGVLVSDTVKLVLDVEAVKQ